jgi:hypothetical protein
MAVYGIGAHLDVGDVTEQFVAGGVACLGWNEQQAPPAHAILRQMRIGDIIFVKANTPQGGLTIKAVGVVTDATIRKIATLGSCVSVRWVWTGKERVGKLDDKWPVRSVTLYEEHHPQVQAKVISLLLDHNQ